jgi:hypothetical protein
LNALTAVEFSAGNRKEEKAEEGITIPRAVTIRILLLRRFS